MSSTLISAPDKSSFAMIYSSKFTSSAKVMRPVWIRKILLFVFSSGKGNSIFLSIRPRKRELTRLLQTINPTSSNHQPNLFKPSIQLFQTINPTSSNHQSNFFKPSIQLLQTNYFPCRL